MSIKTIKLFQGTLPTISDGVVDREACKVGFDSCCTKTYNIQIKHCGSFYAYCLAALDTCPERYCFGNVIYRFHCMAYRMCRNFTLHMNKYIEISNK